MAGLVLELQADALNDNVPILSLLRKARALSVKLSVTTIDTWLEHEMNGYPPGAPIPEYRNVTGKTVCFNPYRGWIPLDINDPEFQAVLCERKIHMPLSEICQFTDEKSAGKSVLMGFGPEMAAQLMAGMGERFEPGLEVATNLLHGMISTVRNKILDFSLELEKQGILGEGLTFSQEEKMAATHISYTTNIENMADSQLQQGTTSSTQTYTQTADLRGLSNFVERLLSAIGELRDVHDREQLQSDLETIRSQINAPRPKFGMIKECMNSVKSILEHAASSVLSSEFLPLLTPILASLPS